MKAIDLYSGVGGWSLGLKMAGIEVVQSYEWWEPAATTHLKNLGGDVAQVDIRKLQLEELPSGIDLVVGSPPCTQFSYSNRGGSGDVQDGLKDIHKFLEIVEHLEPSHWVMENIPRVASILERELGPGGLLRRFKNLVDVIEVVDCALFGIPQRRRRMLAGRFPFDVLDSYTRRSAELTLSQVISALESDPVVDPIYGYPLPLCHLTDNDREAPLDDEEARLNRESKLNHPVYNVMPYPEPLDRPARTITVTESRVSRESLIVLDNEDDSYRRLSNRERAVLQSFPITYQFFGRSYSDRLKMVGNAIPPVLTYHIGHAVMGTKPEDLPNISDSEYHQDLPEELPATPHRGPVAKKYPVKWRFRAAIPHLRFGSGVRFDLSNDFDGDMVSWRVRFYFGASKDYRYVEPDDHLLDMAKTALEDEALFDRALDIIRTRFADIGQCDSGDIQAVWSHHRRNGLGPFDVVDAMGRCVPDVSDILPPSKKPNVHIFISKLVNGTGTNDPLASKTSEQKIQQICLRAFAGLLVAGWFNG